MFTGPWSKMFVRFQLAIFCLLTLIIATPASGQSTPVFPALGTYPISFATAFATGDFNGDGKTDLVYLGQPSSGKGSVKVLLYQGPTTDPISVATDNISCTTVASVAAADMNKDGKLDVVLGCAEGVVLELYGNGDGTFQAAVTVLLDGPAAQVAAGDLNADGYPDLAVLINTGGPYVNSPSYKIRVLLNNGGSSPGTLSLAGSSVLPSSVTAYPPKTGDFNGDGKLDVLVGCYVAFGNGDGTLQAPAPLPCNGSIEVGDFNNDGITDLASVSSTTTNGATSYSLNVILGTTSAQFSVTSSLPWSGYATVVAIGNNGDGNLDLAVVGTATTILRGDGHGAFAFGQSYAITGTPIVVNPDDNGRVSLTFYTNLNASVVLRYLTGNGDGTFQGPPTQPAQGPPALPPGPNQFATADLNGDGIADIAYFDPKGNLLVALGRGNGTFTVTNQINAVAGARLNTLLIMGDFDADGKVDIIGTAPGLGTGHGNNTLVNSTVTFYKGNGDGTVTRSTTPQEIAIYGPPGPIVGAIGDFNSDNKLDVIIGWVNMADPSGAGFILLAGHGDGTFSASSPVSGGSPDDPILTGDMNNDNKLDFVWGQNVYLANGDGTFTLFPMNLPPPEVNAGSPAPNALADLNGDGVLDVVAGSGVYAGYGNGGVQGSPLFYVSLPTFRGSMPSVIGDLNADGHPDLIFVYEKDVSPVNNLFAVYFGDGVGHFTPDSNSYTAGSHPYSSGDVRSMLFLTRLNNQAPAGSADKALDLLVYSNGGATSLINQTNPAPGPLTPISSHISVSASPSSAGINQQFTFTVLVTGANPTGNITLKSGSTTLGTKTLAGGSATLSASFTAAGTYPVTASYSGDSNNLASVSAPFSVTATPSSTTTVLSASSVNANQGQAITYTATITGTNPTGTVTFTSGSTTLGKSNVTNGVAMLSASFATAGTYSVTASYSGDANNQASTSSAVSIAVVAPDYTLTANPASATIKAGQTASFSLSMTSVGGYSGIVKLSCGSLPAEATCTFSPATLTGSGTSANSTLTVTTTAASTATLERPGSPSTRIAVWAVLLGLCLSPQRFLRSRKHLARIMAILFLTLGSLTYLAGCSSSSSTPKNAGTPLGTQMISVSAADSGSGPSHNLNIQLIVQ